MNDAPFAERLLEWFDLHGRKDLPWQKEPTPYRVWVSEIMLQQTQVNTVIPYYERFIAAYPNVETLAAAPLDDVLHLWSGLGYYARARNLHKAARMIRDVHDGKFPRAFGDVIELPGIGRSTAGAVLSLSRDQRHPILDGNVKRVLARYHAVAGWPGKTAVLNSLWELADRHTPAVRAAAYTQAIMDLGATLCSRSNPDCPNCPLRRDCAARRSGRQAEFPGKRERKEKPLKSTLMLLAHYDGQLYLERRPSAGIWGGLWSLPEFGSRAALNEWCLRKLGAEPRDVVDWAPIRHGFSHFDLHIAPVEVRLDSASRRVSDGSMEVWYALDCPPGLGLAAPVKTLIDKLSSSGSN